MAGDFLKFGQLRQFSDRQALWAQVEEFADAVHASLDPRQAAYTIANEGRRLIECDRLSVAINQGRRCVVEAVSGQDILDKRSNTVRLLGKLATAVAATGEPIWYTGDTADMAPQVERFPPQKITLEEIQQFLGMLHQSGLVLATVPGQGRQLLKRRLQRRRRELLGAVSNVLCIRFREFDPERVLNWLHPRAGWLFSPVAVGLCLLLALAALSLVTVQFDVFRSKLPDFYQFFSVRNAFLLAVVLAATKVLHDFGHGLACKHFGGECHEMGIMILVLTPCLYCNVSDSWLLPNKWHRAAIGAADPPDGQLPPVGQPLLEPE